MACGILSSEILKSSFLEIRDELVAAIEHREKHVNEVDGLRDPRLDSAPKFRGAVAVEPLVAGSGAGRGLLRSIADGGEDEHQRQRAEIQ